MEYLSLHLNLSFQFLSKAIEKARFYFDFQLVILSIQVSAQRYKHVYALKLPCKKDKIAYSVNIHCKLEPSAATDVCCALKALVNYLGSVALYCNRQLQKVTCWVYKYLALGYIWWSKYCSIFNSCSFCQHCLKIDICDSSI